ncbi:hypothetical protein RHMOL_Rhmol02G0208900 [Rhododendron molle]|uniref:Uncharacterized protein n=1 Tax=Rhododendron molle TaxID=49168 RepID=A0ACC0PV55_RHOML|nr:hypothetical protein RHMOL_Rhmol02G0208900 [Rhododendron molle]
MSGPPDDHSARLYDKYKEVLPSLREKHDEFMLRELMKRWANHKDMVYRELKGEVRDAVITLIGMGQMVDYENDFEDDMLKDSASYYSRKASNWIVEDSCPDYMLKVEQCLEKERDRVSHYLHSSSEQKLAEARFWELIFALQVFL